MSFARKDLSKPNKIIMTIDKRRANRIFRNEKLEIFSAMSSLQGYKFISERRLAGQ